jgi:hypothetical protein
MTDWANLVTILLGLSAIVTEVTSIAESCVVANCGSLDSTNESILSEMSIWTDMAIFR